RDIVALRRSRRRAASVNQCEVGKKCRGNPSEHALSTVLFVLLINIRICHARDVVANDAGQWLGICLFLVAGGKSFGMLHPKLEEIADDALTILFLRFERRAVVKVLIQELFGLPPFGLGVGTQSSKTPRVGLNVVESRETRGFYLRLRVANQVSDPTIENTA